MSNKIIILMLAAMLLAACGTVSQRKTETPAAPAESREAGTPKGGYLAGDGPGADVPANLEATPDAVPKNEPLHRYANRPYVALGKTYTPLTVPGNFKERGIASWYGKKFHGERTSSGEIYDMYAMTAAHPTLPLPSYARVTNTANKKSVIVRINDRGPFLNDRVIDLSYTAAYKLGIAGNGSAEVEVESIVPETVTNVIAANTVQSQPLDNSPVVTSPLAVAPVAAPMAATSPESSTGVYLQLGAFKSQEGAESFMEKMRGQLAGSGKQLKLSSKDGLVRVHIGPYGSQSEARSSAESLEGKLGFKPMVNLQ
ncbi:MAG: septal ring lytic transglycosylase RlpA family protein [Nitrosomonadales bacterium]|nr:septal ring lytic transglycosylase RlpA family protein [Nitrosomonadales bacterium]